MAKKLNPSIDDPIIRRQALRALLGVSETTFWRMRHELPPSIHIFGNVTGWRKSTIDAWLAARTHTKTPS